MNNPNINKTVQFTHGQVPDLLRKMEQFLGVALSLRSITGEVVVKTDYFYGPCSIIRGTERGRSRCRKTYRNIEDRLLRRKVPFVNICYAGFLIFAVPLEFRGEMVGTLLGTQIPPMRMNDRSDLDTFFGHTLAALDIRDQEGFYHSFSRVKAMDHDFQRISFMQFLEMIGHNFTQMAFAGETWPQFLARLREELPSFGRL